MSERFDEELRRALRPVDPGEDFTHAVLARIEAERRVAPHAIQRPRVWLRALQWAPAALAASLLVAIILEHDPSQMPDAAEGLRAREQLIEALRVTSEKLDLAYQVVHDQGDGNGDAGA